MGTRQESRGDVPSPGGHRARKRFGQHFLAREWSQKLIAAIAPASDETFLEVGPGQGAITRALAARSRGVVAVEVDRDLVERLRGEAIAGVTIVEGDVLEVDLTALGLPADTRIAGNLPYNISSPILFKVLATQRATGLFRDATFMLQREVADRLVAKPGTKDYGLLTVFTALEASVAKQLTLPPGAFRPPPKVTSAVVRLTFLPSDRRPMVPATFGPMVQALFGMRRKTIANGLKGPARAAGLSPADALRLADLDPRLRPEQLPVDDLIRLATVLEAAVADRPD
jgi:16S rRNA (adenine1518-N6/adenine1519-N6)-dimethyltransferase